MKVINAHYAHPQNARSGLYVQVEGNVGDMGSKALKMAKAVAAKMGFKPGEDFVQGSPCHGENTVTQAFWFYAFNVEANASPAKLNDIAHAACHGPRAVYQYPWQRSMAD